MKPRRIPLAMMAFLALLLAAPSLEAAMVARMDLDDLARNAAHIFRGTVVDVEQSSISVGGGELPVVVVTLRVDETFKGDFGSGKDAMVKEVRMLGSIKDQTVTVGDYQRVSVLPDMPSLQRGHDYVLFTSAPSAIGLSTTVGLGQGSFRIYEQDHQELATNELGNAGIFAGPVTYDDLAAAIEAEVGN